MFLMLIKKLYKCINCTYVSTYQIHTMLYRMEKVATQAILPVQRAEPLFVLLVSF